MSNNNPGCLASLLSLLGLGDHQPTAQDNTVTYTKIKVETYPYRLRDDFLSPAELSIYFVLKNVLQDRYIICPKVALSDLFFVTRPNENRGAYNRIDRKHVDFVICTPKPLKPVFAVELDDKSHEREDRKDRDDFVEKVFQAASLPLLRIPARHSYNTAEIQVLIKNALGIDLITPSDHTENEVVVEEGLSGADVPTCPKCGFNGTAHGPAR